MNMIVQPASKMQRVNRYPKHTFYIRSWPMAIQPFCIAPVLPGETLKSLALQCQALTAPIKNNLIGWWLEHHFFYVPLSIMATETDGVNAFTSPTGLLMNPNYDPSALADSASTAYYHEDTASINYLKRAYELIVKHWFRDEGRAISDGLITVPYGLGYMAQMKRPGWMDSAIPTATYTSGAPDIPDDADNATLQRLMQLQEIWDMVRMNNVQGITYEDFIASWGIKLPGAQANIPERLASWQAWQVPSTAVDGATGATSSVVSWRVEESTGERKAFKEHGFIVGVTVPRPKMYLGAQRTNAVSMLDNAFSWNPLVMRAHEGPLTMKQLADGRGPIYDVDASLTVDTKDLFLYGDQFTNNSLNSPAWDMNLWNNTTLTGDNKFNTVSDIQGLFTASADTGRYVAQDGQVRLTIAGVQRDTSPQNVGRTLIGL